MAMVHMWKAYIKFKQTKLGNYHSLAHTNLLIGVCLCLHKQSSKTQGNQIQGILREDLRATKFKEKFVSHIYQQPDREAAKKTLNTNMMLHSLHQVVHS
jgi:hypothetical protein